MRWTIILLLTLVCSPVQAQDAEKSEPEAASDSETTAEGSSPAVPDDLEPEVTIRTEGETTFEEHRVNGKLVMVKVTPKHGVPYYLLDRDGDGQFETRLTDLENDVSVPMWLIKKW
ncbi:MAG: DUF2782 domain-containing protein [Gammaproteobacteria bacterium]|nr:DUF2782 domain-containing protein [Gammaproteobacteria bacterium]